MQRIENNDIKAIKDNRFTRRQKFFSVLFVVLMLPLFFVAKSAFTVLAQTKDYHEKTIKKISFEREPIEFIEFKSDGKPIKSDEFFTRDNDWLRDFSIEFRNRSGKPITFVSIALGFPQTRSEEPPLGHLMTYGIPNTVNQVSSKEKPVLINPNDSATIKISAEAYMGLKQFLETRRSINDLTVMDYRINIIHFQDGTKWIAGVYLRPDPEHPGKSIPDDTKNKEEKR